VASAGLGGLAVGGARSVPDHAARSNSERTAAKDCVDNRFGSQVVWNRSNRCAGERGGARVGRPRWVRILTITGRSSIAAMIFKLPMGPALAVAVRLSQFVFSFRHRYFAENDGMPRLRRASAGVALTRPRATELV